MSDARNCCSCKPHRRKVMISLISENLTSNLTGEKLEDSLFVVSGSREKICGVSTGRKYVGIVGYRGIEYLIDYKKPMTNPRTRVEIIETDDEVIWHVKMGNNRQIITANIRCAKEGMEVLEQSAQDGSSNRSLRGTTGTGTVKLYQREGNYCSLVDNIEVKDVVCGFGVITR